MRLHERFEWDATKARTNLRKHCVSFDDAAAVLADERGSELHVEEFDGGHGGEEERWVTTGSHPADREIVLRIAWTERADRSGVLTRIISVRPATATERRLYETEVEHEN